MLNLLKKFSILFIIFFIFQCSKKANLNLNSKELLIFSKLSEYEFVERDSQGKLKFKESGLKYTLNTALFSDYAHKERIIFLPNSTQIQYDSKKVFDMPIGTVITKTFFMPKNLLKPTENLQKLETRLLIHQPKGWFAVSYIWDKEETEAEIAYGGKIIPLKIIDQEGKDIQFNYLVPSRNQCFNCHQAYEGNTQAIVPIGIQAKHLNKEISLGVSQLELWEKKGVLVGFLNFSVPKLPDAFDERYSLEERARAYLDINCSYCHNTKGAGGLNSKLVLTFEETNLQEIGVCKTPGSAGKGGGGLRYDIVPSKAEESILYYRISTTESGAMMPPIGRALVHKEGVKLIQDWINSMPLKNCF